MPSHQLPTPSGTYSLIRRAGGLIFTAGLGPHDPETGEVVGTTVEEQTRQTMRNIEQVLLANGSGPGDIVKVTAHLQHLERDFAAFDEAYRRTVVEPYPVRTTVGSDLGGILVEIDVVALAGPPDVAGTEAETVGRAR